MVTPTVLPASCGWSQASLLSHIGFVSCMLPPQARQTAALSGYGPRPPQCRVVFVGSNVMADEEGK
jgi:hypothetical protein